MEYFANDTLFSLFNILKYEFIAKRYHLLLIETSVKNIVNCVFPNEKVCNHANIIEV